MGEYSSLVIGVVFSVTVFAATVIYMKAKERPKNNGQTGTRLPRSR